MSHYSSSDGWKGTEEHGFGWIGPSNDLQSRNWNFEILIHTIRDSVNRVIAVSLRNICIINNSDSKFNVNISGTFAGIGINNSINVGGRGSYYLYDTDDSEIGNILASKTINFDDNGYPVGYVDVDLSADNGSTRVNYLKYIKGVSELGTIPPNYRSPMSPSISIKGGTIDNGILQFNHKTNISLSFTGQSNKSSVDSTSIEFQFSYKNNFTSSSTKSYIYNEGTNVSNGTISIEINSENFPISKSVDSGFIYIRARRCHNNTSEKSGFSGTLKFKYLIKPIDKPKNVKIYLNSKQLTSDTTILTNSIKSVSIKVSAQYRSGDYGLVSGYRISIYSYSDNKSILNKYCTAISPQSDKFAMSNFQINLEDNTLKLGVEYCIKLSAYYNGEYYSEKAQYTDAVSSYKFMFTGDITGLSPIINYPITGSNLLCTAKQIIVNNKETTVNYYNGLILFKLPKDPDYENNNLSKYSDIQVVINNNSEHTYTYKKNPEYFNSDLTSESNSAFKVPNIALTSIKIRVCKGNYYSQYANSAYNSIAFNNNYTYTKESKIKVEDINNSINLINEQLACYGISKSNKLSAGTTIKLSTFTKLYDKLLENYSRINGYCETWNNTSIKPKSLKNIIPSDVTIITAGKSSSAGINLFSLILDVLKTLIE